MHSWIVETERILAAGWGEPKEVLTTAQVAQRFDRWVSDLEHLAQRGTLNTDEQRCLEHFLTVTQSQRPRLLSCYDRSEEHTSELQSPDHLVCRLLLEKKKTLNTIPSSFNRPVVKRQ